MKLAFISGPYRAKTTMKIIDNIRFAESYALKYWKMGYAVICPHKNSALFDGEADDSVWLRGDLKILSRCDVIVMIPGWEDSTGSIAEHAFATQNGMEIIYEFIMARCTVEIVGGDMSEQLCKLCGRPEHEHHEFVHDMPDGCVCDPGTWGYPPVPVCDEYAGEGGYCLTCSHDEACHKREEKP